MTWTTPKTNWAAHWDDDGNYLGDYFNLADYNRITGNMKHLQQIAAEVFGADTDRVFAEKTYSSYYYATDVNAITGSLNDLRDQTYAVVSGTFPTYSGNQGFPDYVMLNRIESAQLAYYNMINATKSIQRRLAFTLGRPTLGNRY